MGDGGVQQHTQNGKTGTISLDSWEEQDIDKSWIRESETFIAHFMCETSVCAGAMTMCVYFELCFFICVKSAFLAKLCEKRTIANWQKPEKSA